MIHVSFSVLHNTVKEKLSHINETVLRQPFPEICTSTITFTKLGHAPQCEQLSWCSEVQTEEEDGGAG